ncbi:hypothetical protein D770_20980 [Flammeovirgaceae bacterium 311]|nr:hypothetical protein D770_20980 [Flammeovirgaceae bacterium 311]
MNKIYNVLLWLGVMVASVACVDDYFEANPPLPQDSPYSTLTVEEDTLFGGETTNFSVRVVDAPGLIDSIGYQTTDSKGTVVFDQASLNAAMGNTSGVINGQFTAPTNASGAFTLSIIVYDAQGEQRKTHTMSETIFIRYSLNAPTYTITAQNAEINPGGTTEVYLDINAPGGIADARIFANFGTVVLDTATLDAVRGMETGRVTARYTAPSIPTTNVGPVTFTAFVEDELQEREVRMTGQPVTIVYTEAAPTIAITGPTTAERGTYSMNANITSPGIIDTVIVTAFINNRDTEVGQITLSDEDLEALEGETSGTLPISLTVNDFIGYVDLRVTVIDRQGRSSTQTYTVRVDPCTYNMAGTYTTSTNATSTDPDCDDATALNNFASTATITRTNETTYRISNILGGAYVEWYGDCYGQAAQTAANVRFDCENNTVSIVGFTGPFSSRITGSGTVDPATGAITITWRNTFGDTGTTVFRK